jgi:hypothetical protein
MASPAISQDGSAPTTLTVIPARASRLSWSVLAATSAYTLLVALVVLHHEPWADEAQAWLLGRDASLRDLWLRFLHYEGSPGLWQTLAHGLAHAGLPYGAYRFVPLLLTLAAVAVLVRYAPLPLFLRILLPFTYYLCYQYAVVARSYALVAPLLFAIAVLVPQAARRPVLMTTLLGLLAGVSVHGFILSVCIWLTCFAPLFRSEPAAQRRKIAVLSLAYLAVLAFFALAAWPASNVAFAEHRGLANLGLFWEVAKMNLSGAFVGYWLPSFVLMALSLPFLWRGGGALFFLLTGTTLCLFGAIVYAQVWHFGVLFLAWLFAIWISAYKTPLDHVTRLALIAVIGFQCYWTAAAVYYDWTHAYSGGRTAAEYFHQKGLPSGGLYAIGYSTTALQPYFPANIYSNTQGGSRNGYWDWSNKNNANDPDSLFASTRREQVLVGYTEAGRRKLWADLLDLLGYKRVQSFEGHTFWQTNVFEAESFDLYRQT